MKFVAVVGVLCMATVLFAEEMTVYRTIVAQGESAEALASYQEPGQEIVEHRGKFVVVEGWFENFEDAMPEAGQGEEWNKRWKHVLPVDLSKQDARTRGFSVPELKTEAILRQRSAAPESFATRLQRSRAVERVIQDVRNLEEQEGATTRQLVNRLKSEYENLAIQAREGSGANAERAQFWLAKAYYLEGLLSSMQRLPKTQGMTERYAWPQEELAYESSLAEFRKFQERFPGSEKSEIVAYHIAGLHYHLTYRGHHRHQVDKAIQVYSSFIDAYPKSNKVPRAYLNLLGLSLEIARMDDSGYENVITKYEALVSNYPDANLYVSQRSKLIAAEAYYEGPKDYVTAKKLTDELIVENGSSENYELLGSLYRLRAYCNLKLELYEESIPDWSFVIDLLSHERFHFGYRIKEKMAAAHFFRAKSYLRMSDRESAEKDFLTILHEYPDSSYAQIAEIEMQVGQRMRMPLVQRLQQISENGGQ